MLLNTNTRKKLSYIMLPVMILYTVLPTTAYGAETYTEVQANAYNSDAGNINKYDDSKTAAEALNKEAAKSAAQAAKEKEENPASSSAASNYTMGIGAEVNVQTGQLDVTFNDIKLNGISEDVGIDLGISNGGGAKKILGLPVGWKFSVDYIDTKAKPQKLYMNGSQSYTIDSKFYSYDSEGKKYYSGLRYCTSKGIKFEDKKAKIDLPYDTKLKYCYILSTSKGSHEYFDYYGKLICQDDRFGNHIIYSYDRPDKSPYEAKLTKITDSYGQDITIGYKGNVITATMPDGKTVVYDFSSKSKIKIKGVSGREASLYLNKDNKVSKIEYPTGGYIEYIYANNAIPYRVNGTTQHFEGIKEVKQHPDTKTIIRTEYNYNANPGHSFAGAGLCDYASDKDALLESSNNSYKYATKIISHRSPECGGNIESVQTFNFLHLPLSSTITSIPDPSDPSKSRKLLVETKTRYMGEHGKGEDFPAFNQLHANYNLPSEVTSTIDGRVHHVETKYDDYDRQVSVTNHNDGEVSSKTETIYGSYDLVTKQSVYDSIDKTTTIATNKLSSDGKYITESRALINSDSKDGKTTTLTADEHGRMTSSKLSNSSESSTSTTDYKQNGSLLTIITTNALGKSTSQEIDIRNGNILSETDAKGNSVRYTYDTTGTLLTKTYPDGSWEKTDSSNPNKTVTSYSNGMINTSILDGFGRVIEEYDNYGGRNTVTYNELGKPAVKTDVFGHSIKYTYDYQGRETSATDSLGNVKSTVYDDGKQTATQYINGIKAVLSQLDDNGNVKNQTNFLSNSDSIASSTYNGKNMELTSALAIAGKGNIISSASSYDIDGNLIKAEVSTTDGTKGTSEYTLNLFGDIVSRNTQFSSVSPGVEKGTGEVKSEIKTYNKIGQLTSLTNQAGQTIEYTYDANGNLETMKDFAGNIFSYTYDNMGRMLTMEGPDYKVENEYYGVGIKGAEGQLKSRNLINPKDGTIIDTISYGYDVQGRLAKVTYMNGKSMSMTYDNFDRVVSMTDFAGSVNTYTYDSLIPDNITSVSNNFGKASYSYYSREDNAMFGDGKTVSKVTYSNGVTISFKYKVSKDKSPILTSVETCDDENSLISGSYYEYDDLDRVATLTQKSATSSDDSNCNNTRYFTYNLNNQLIKEDVYDKDEVKVTSTSYVFDINGNIIRRIIIDKDNKIIESNEYLYNVIDQLVRITGINGVVRDFKYDANGNMTDIVAGNVKLKHFKYNSINQLVEYSDAKGINVCYEYNAESLRKCKYFKGDGGRRINYYYSQEGEIMNEEANNDLASNGQANNGQTNIGLMTSYLIAGTRVLRAVISSTDNGQQLTDNVSWYIMNGKDVVSTVDDDDEITNVYNYNAYGEDVDLNSNPPTLELSNFRTLEFDLKSNPYKYSDYYLDEESGMYYLQARYYSPELMRFISRDTYDLSNRYAYGDGDPISQVDPKGHMSQAANYGIGVFSLILGCIMTASVIGLGLAIFSTGGGALPVLAGIFGTAGAATAMAGEIVSDEKTKEALGWTSLACGVLSIGLGFSHHLKPAKLKVKEITITRIEDTQPMKEVGKGKFFDINGSKPASLYKGTKKPSVQAFMEKDIKGGKFTNEAQDIQGRLNLFNEKIEPLSTSTFSPTQSVSVHELGGYEMVNNVMTLKQPISTGKVTRISSDVHFDISIKLECEGEKQIELFIKKAHRFLHSDTKPSTTGFLGEANIFKILQ